VVAPLNPKRLVYNRVNKAGSTTVKSVLEITLQRKHRRVQNGFPYFPNETEYTLAVTSLREGDVYVNHASVVTRLAPPHNPDIGWINLVRDPVARAASMYYYAVDPTSRSQAQAAEELAKRKADFNCGCHNLDFDACVQTMVDNGCSFRIQSQMTYFCSIDAPPSPTGHPINCTADAALAQVERLYAFVGLTEELALSLAALEVLLPSYFAGALAAAKAVPRHMQRHTSIRNPLTNTTGSSSSVSAVTIGLLKTHWPGFTDEYKFYNGVRKLFWCKIATLGLAPGKG
jgi:hypothetical protein